MADTTATFTPAESGPKFTVQALFKGWDKGDYRLPMNGNLIQDAAHLATLFRRCVYMTAQKVGVIRVTNLFGKTEELPKLKWRVRAPIEGGRSNKWEEGEHAVQKFTSDGKSARVEGKTGWERDR